MIPFSRVSCLPSIEPYRLTACWRMAGSTESIVSQNVMLYVGTKFGLMCGHSSPGGKSVLYFHTSLLMVGHCKKISRLARSMTKATTALERG